MRVLVCAGDRVACCAGTDGIAARVQTALVAPVEPGDVLFVHAGIALARLDHEWAP
jgi:hydrogenase maturation factor